MIFEWYFPDLVIFGCYETNFSFNNWISKWVLIELSAANKKFAWTNNQDNRILAKIDRIFVSTTWEAAFPLSAVKALDRIPSDRNPLVLNAGENCCFGKKRFRFEKWWLEKESFREVVEKAWKTPCFLTKSIDRWQFKIRTLRRIVRGWAANEVADLNRDKVSLSKKFTRLEGLAEHRALSPEQSKDLRTIDSQLDKI